MRSHIHIIRNEDGSIMVIALLIMSILTILGISAIDMSNIEIQIASNERVYKQNFYRAEAAAIAATQRLENMGAGQLSDISDDAWITTSSFDVTAADSLKTGSPEAWTGRWDGTGTGHTNARYTVVESTGFIDLSASSNLHEYTIYGAYDSDFRDRGQVIVEMGYKRRF